MQAEYVPFLVVDGHKGVLGETGKILVGFGGTESPKLPAPGRQFQCGGAPVGRGVTSTAGELTPE